MTQDKPAGWLLGNAAHGWRGIERFEHIAQHVGTGQTEMDVGTQMAQTGRRHRVGTLQTIVVGEGLDARLDIIGDVLLLLLVLLRPLQVLGRLVRDGAHGCHGRFLSTGKRHGVVLARPPIEQHLGRRHEPHARSLGTH